MAEIKQLQDAVDYIEHNITEDLTSSEIAKQACMSINSMWIHCRRVYKKQTAFTFGNGITSIRKKYY